MHRLAAAVPKLPISRHKTRSPEWLINAQARIESAGQFRECGFRASNV
jgi:hypothetical protein